LRFEVQGSGFRVQREEIRDKEIGFSLQEFGLSIYNVGLGFRIK
jgi:hypothetical protein